MIMFNNHSNLTTDVVQEIIIEDDQFGMVGILHNVHRNAKEFQSFFVLRIFCFQRELTSLRFVLIGVGVI